MAAAEFVPEGEALATLVLDDGGVRVQVHYAVSHLEGETTGYLRLAYGQGAFVNKLLNNVGHTARLIDEDGTSRPITLTSSDPTEAPGFLCTFSFRSVA